MDEQNKWLKIYNEEALHCKWIDQYIGVLLSTCSTILTTVSNDIETTKHNTNLFAQNVQDIMSHISKLSNHEKRRSINEVSDIFNAIFIAPKSFDSPNRTCRVRTRFDPISLMHSDQQDFEITKDMINTDCYIFAIPVKPDDLADNAYWSRMLSQLDAITEHIQPHQTLQILILFDPQCVKGCLTTVGLFSRLGGTEQSSNNLKNMPLAKPYIHWRIWFLSADDSQKYNLDECFYWAISEKENLPSKTN